MQEQAFKRTGAVKSYGQAMPAPVERGLMSRKAAGEKLHNDLKTQSMPYQTQIKKKKEIDTKTNERFFPSKPAYVPLKEEKEIIKETEYEFERRQGWKRIFPTVDY